MTTMEILYAIGIMIILGCGIYFMFIKETMDFIETEEKDDKNYWKSTDKKRNKFKKILILIYVIFIIMVAAFMASSLFKEVP